MMRHTFKSVLAAVIAIIMLVSVVPLSVMGDEALPFEDVKSADYFSEAVSWAYDEGITTGTTKTKFAPMTTCTRGQVVTFLWRAAGKTEPETKNNPFEDVTEKDYYYKPILWAVENGITTGTSEKRFSPDVTCTNAHILTFIWRAVGEPEKTGTGEWYSDALNWAKRGGFVEGTYTGEFDINAGCPRANVVEYLYRYSESTAFTFYVLAGADASQADGSEQRPFATIEAARDAVRGIDKKGYNRINVRILPGEYYLKNTVKFTKADSGTEECQIRYIGEEGTVITGGVTLTSSDFKAAEGDTVQYFPEDAVDSIVMADLKPYGITKEYVAEKYAQDDITYGTLVTLYVDGELGTIARYPNESYAAIEEGDIVLIDETAEDVNSQYIKTVKVSDEVAAEIASWHDVSTVFTVSRHTALWRPNNYRILSYSADTKTVTLPYTHGWYSESAYNNYKPKSGMPIVFENIPEELDVPGEYYIDENAVLYMYKTENWDSVHISLPVSDTAFSIKDAKYISLENLLIESFVSNAVTAETDRFTLDECEIRGIGGEAVRIVGNNNVIRGNNIHDVSFTALTVGGGDCETLTPSETVVENNEIHDWGQVVPYYEEAVNLLGCGVTVAHNHIYNGDHEAITWEGNNHIVEYNEINDVCRLSDDAGAIYSYNSYAHYGNVFRYNYIHDIGLRDDFLANIKDYVYCYTSGIYLDGGKAGQTVYGNIIENVTGCGVRISGRDCTATNNLFISCGYSVSITDCFYGYEFGSGAGDEGGGKDHQGFSGKENNAAWQAAFPELYKIKWEDSDKDPDDPYYYKAPAGIVVKDNYYYFDKANIRSLAAYGHMFTIETNAAIAKFNGENVEEAVEGVNQTTYTSKRETLDVRDAIEKTQAVTGITLEMFDSIGIVD